MHTSKTTSQKGGGHPFRLCSVPFRLLSLMALVLVLGAPVSWSSAAELAAPDGRSGDDPRRLPADLDPQRELTAERTPFSATFKDANENYTTIVSTQALHYQDAGGSWQAINAAFATSPEGFAVEKNSIQSQVGLRQPWLGLRVGETAVVWEATALGTSGIDGFTALAAPLPEGVLPQQDQQRRVLTYSGGWSDPSLLEQISSAPGSIEHTLVLAAPPHAAAPARYLELQATLDLLPGATLAADGAAQEGAFVTSGALEVRGADGQVAMIFDPVLAYEQDNRSQAVTGEYLAEPGEEDGRWLVRVRTPLSWWQDAARQYPAVLDPTIHVLQTAGFGNGMAFVTDAPNSGYLSDAMVLGSYPNYNSLTRGYMQFNIMPAVLQADGGPLNIDKVWLDIAPTGLWVPKWYHKPKSSFPNWDKIALKRAATVRYVDVCAGQLDVATCLSDSATFSMLDDRLANQANFNWDNSPQGMDLDAEPQSQLLSAGPVKSKFTPKATTWDVTHEVKDLWYTNFYAAYPSRLGPTFMIQFDQTCPSAPPYENSKSPLAKICDIYYFDLSSANLRIEYTRPPLAAGSNILNAPGVPSYLEGILDNDTTNHQYDLAAGTPNVWRGIAVRGNHALEQTLPARAGLRLLDGEDLVAQVSGTMPDETVFMMMDGRNTASGIASTPLTAEVTSSSDNNFYDDQLRNYRVQVVDPIDSIPAELGSFAYWSLELPSDELLQIHEIGGSTPLGYGENIAVWASGSPELGVALVKPTMAGSDLASGVAGGGNIMPLKDLGNGTLGTSIPYIKTPGRYALAVYNKGFPEPGNPEDPDQDVAVRTLDLTILRCTEGTIGTAHYPCQPLRLPQSIQSKSIPTLGLTVYAAAFKTINPQYGDWCSDAEGSAAPLIAKSGAPSNNWVVVAQGQVCYDGSTQTLRTSEDSGIGLAVPLAGANPSLLGAKGVTVYGSELLYPVPSGIPDGVTTITAEDVGATLQRLANTRRNLQPFDPLWTDGGEYQHSDDYISLTEMKAHATGQIDAAVSVEASAAPQAVTWNTSWTLWTDLGQQGIYGFDLVVDQQDLLPQPLDIASADLQLYGDGFTTPADGRFGEMLYRQKDTGPEAQDFFARYARLTNDELLGGATKYVRAVVQPPGKPRLPDDNKVCSYGGTSTSCLDLRVADFTWDKYADSTAVTAWELPDVTITGEAATVAFATAGELDVFSSDHPLAKQSASDISQSFAFDTWEATATITEGPCTPGGPNKTIIHGTGKIALPMIGDNGSGSGPYADVDFSLCDSALQQAELTLGPIAKPIPVGSTGLGVDLIGGKITVGPDSTRVALNVGLLTTDGGVTLSKGGVEKNGTLTIDTAGLFSLDGSGRIVGKLDATYELDVAWSPLDVLVQGDVDYGGGLIYGVLRLHGWVGQGWQGKYSYLAANDDFHFTGQIGATIRIKKGQLIDKKYLKVPWFNTSFSAEVAFGEFCSNTSTCVPVRWGMSATVKVFGYGVGVYVDKSGPDIFLGSGKKVLIDQCTGCGTLLNTVQPRRPATVNEPSAALAFENATITPGAEQAYLALGFPDPFEGTSPISDGSACTGEGTATVTCTLAVDPGTGRALFSASWLNGILDVALINPGGVVITAANAAQNGVTITPYVDDQGLHQGVNFAVNPATPGGSIPSGDWKIRLDNVSLDPNPFNFYSLSLAADPPLPNVTWTSVLNPGTTPAGGILPLSWQANRSGQLLEDNVSLELFYAPVFQAPAWQPLTASFPGDYMEVAGLGTNWDAAENNIQAGDPNQDGIWRIGVGVGETPAIPAGDYSFLVARNAALEEYYGLEGVYQGKPIDFTVPANNQPVIFYYDPRDNYATTDTETRIVTLIGDMMGEIGGQDWTATNLVGWMKPGSESDTLYETTLAIPAGQWSYKVALDEDPAMTYGANGIPNGDAIPFTVPDGDALVKFTYDDSTHTLTHEVLAGTPGTMITRLGLPGSSPNAGSYNWSTASLASGEYRVGLRVDDHHQGNGQITSWAPGTVLISGDTTPPPVPAIQGMYPSKDALNVYWERDDATPDLAGYLVEYEIPAPEPDAYLQRTRRVLPLPPAVSPFSQSVRLGGLLLSDPDYNLADIMTSVCVRAYDINGNVSGCTPTPLTMPSPEELPNEEEKIGPPQFLSAGGADPMSISWEPPAYGVPDGYLVTYAPTGCLIASEYGPAAEGLPPLYPGNVLGTTLSGLVTDQSYLISVQAYTANNVLSEPATTIGRYLDMTDANNDDLPDIWAEVYGLDDPFGDEDDDGHSNRREAISASNPFAADSDGDGYYDGEETAWGTDLCGPEQPPYHAQPKLALSGPAALSFETAANKPLAGPEVVTVFNEGGGTLGWLATPSDSWIHVSQLGGQGLADVSISVDSTSLSAGEYSGSVVFSSDADAVQVPTGNFVPAISESRTIPVKLTVLPNLTQKGSVVGNIVLQGGIAPGPGLVTLKHDGGIVPDITAEIDPQTGAFTLPPIPAEPTGTSYSVEVSRPLYLSNRLTPLIVFPTTELALSTTTLKGGDTNNDGKIDILDLGCMGGAYLTPGSSCGGKGGTDINADGITNIQDLGIAGGNYNLTAPQPW